MSSAGETQLPVRIYTPESPLRRPAEMVRRMWGELPAARELAWRLFRRNISSQYRRTTLGYLWALLPPLATSAVWIFLNSQQIVSFDSPGVSYPAFVLTGMMLWQTFLAALDAPRLAVDGSRDMLTRVNFPREALLLMALLHVLFDFSIKLALLCGVFVWLQVLPPASIFWAPLGVAAIICFGMMLGLLLMPLCLLSQDFGRAMGLCTGFLFYLTPVIYPAPQTWPGSLINWVNPISPLILVTRDWLLMGGTDHLAAFGGVMLLTVPLLALGLILNRLLMPILIERT